MIRKTPDDLTKEEEQQAKELKGFYKIIMRCKRCGVIYGSDYVDEDNNLCPICTPRGGKSTKQARHRLKKFKRKI
jgi:rubrerythrin